MLGRFERPDGDISQVRGGVDHKARESRRPRVDRQVPKEAQEAKRARPDAVGHLRGKVQGRVHSLRSGCIEVHVEHAAGPAAAAAGQHRRRPRLDQTPGTSCKRLSGSGDDAGFGCLDGDVPTAAPCSRSDDGPRGHITRISTHSFLSVLTGRGSRQEPLHQG